MTNEQYHTLIHPYTDAMNLILTRLEILNHCAADNEDVRPIHGITHRIKEKISMENKLKKKHSNGSVQDARTLLKDIAGIRVICFFERDIYQLAESLKKQTDLILVCEKDYIRHPKPNGYRSYHLVLGVPIYSLDGMEYYPVEIQFRTISMDFWAAMEHRISYKKEYDNREQRVAELLSYADTLVDLEKAFEKYNENATLS